MQLPSPLRPSTTPTAASDLQSQLDALDDEPSSAAGTPIKRSVPAAPAAAALLGQGSLPRAPSSTPGQVRGDAWCLCGSALLGWLCMVSVDGGCECLFACHLTADVFCCICLHHQLCASVSFAACCCECMLLVYVWGRGVSLCWLGTQIGSHKQAHQLQQPSGLCVETMPGPTS